MTLFPKEFPSNIPHILAGFIGLNFGAFLMTALFAEIFIGRASSTSVIGFGFIPIYTLILMVLCYGAGFLIRLVLGKFVSARVLSDKASRVLLLTFLGTLGISFISAWAFAAWEEYQQRPKLIFDSGRVKQVDHLSPKVKIEGKMVLSIYDEDQDKIQPLVWNGKDVKFTHAGNVLKIQRINDGELVTADLRKYPYISRVFAIPIKITGTDNQGLGVVARLRPTSKRAMFLVYDSEGGKLVYQEFIECHGLKGFLSLAKNETGKEYLYLNLETPKIYSMDGS